MTVEEATRYVLRQARARGVAVEVLGERGRELTARVWRGRLDHATHAHQGGLGVRVVMNQRVGYAYSEELSPGVLDWMLQEAIDNAALQSEASGFLPEGGALGAHDLIGSALDGALGAKVHTALGLEATIREDRRTKEVPFAAYCEREREVHLASTHGRAGSYRRGVVGMVGSVVMEDASSHKQGYHADWATHLAEVDPGRTAVTLTERTGRLLGARRLKTGRYTACFEPKPFIGLLAFFWHLWDGKYVVEGKSRLRGRLGEAIATPLVTILDDPTMPKGLATRPFDAEGEPARPVTLVDAGFLRAYLTNSETARALRVVNTGHAARGYRDVLNIAPSNFCFQPGRGVRMHRGVLVTETMGWHAGTNPVTGEFSVQALGLWVENGEVAYPIENFAVAGDFLRLLEHITAVGPTLEWVMELGGGTTPTGTLWGRTAYGVPLIEVEELSFGGW